LVRVSALELLASGLLINELKKELPQLDLVWADGAYTNEFCRWVEEERGWRVEVPYHRNRQLWRYELEEKPRGFRVLPRRWVVSCLGSEDAQPVRKQPSRIRRTVSIRLFQQAGFNEHTPREGSEKSMNSAEGAP
jgi:transposase